MGVYWRYSFYNQETPMRYTRKEREELARRKEQWILRTGRGEAPEQISRELKLNLKSDALRRLKQRYQAGGRKWQALLGQRHGVATKGTAEVKAFLKKAKERDPQVTSAELCVQVWERFEIDISLSRLNELLHAEGLSNAPGRPQKAATPEMSSATKREVDNAGAFFPSGRVDRTGRTGGRAKRR
jgi:transposase